MLVGVIAEELLASAAGPITSAVIDSDIFPQAAIYVPGFLLPGLFVDGDITYGILITNTGAPVLYVSLVDDTDTIYDFTRDHADAIVPALFQSDDAFYQATTPAALGLQLVVDVDRFYSPRNAFNFESAVVVSDDDIHAQIFQYGTTWRTLSASIVDADLFIRPDVSWPVLSAAVADADIFHAPDLPYYLRPSAISDEAIFTAGVGRQVRPGFITDTEQFFDPTIVPPIAPVTLPPGLVVDIDSLFAPTVLQPGILVAQLYSDTDVFLTPTITTGAVTIVPSLFTDTDTFAAPHITTPPATFIGSEIVMMGAQTTYIFDWP